MSDKVKKKCKTCGKLYIPCSDCERDKTAFHWRTVACSYECGMKYFEKVMAARSRNKAIDNMTIEKLDENEVATPVIEEEVVASKKRNKKVSVAVHEEMENVETK